MTAVDALNRAGPDEYRRLVGGVFEHSPWVAERARERRPFATAADLHRATMDVVREASPEEKLRLLCAHPDLAGTAARARAMTDFSTAEQGRAGLDRLTGAEHERFDQLNRAYRERFEFPFIICVRNHDKTGILGAFERRLRHPAATEIEVAIAEIAEITRYRLEALLGEPIPRT